jgi:hypothetical protein
LRQISNANKAANITTATDNRIMMVVVVIKKTVLEYESFGKYTIKKSALQEHRQDW